MFMKKGRMARRVLAVATTIVLIVSSLSSALSVSAEELLAPEVESGEYYAEGSNSLGRLLTEALEEQPTTDGENGVSSIIMEGDTAQVDFHIAVDGVLLVALYDESTRQLLKSGKIQVSPEDQTAQVPLTGISQPYYIVKAFLLDETLAPVCDAYESMEYTAAYADFMSLTTDDFQPDRVINLDEDKANNFLVLGEDVKTADADMGKNVLVSADEAAGVYTFANIGQDIASLQAGDLFYYNTPGAPENLVVIKVKTVEFSGTDAILTADETSIPELFDYVKIDVDNGTEEFTMAEGSVDPSVTYLGNAEGAPQQASAASARIGGESGVEGSHKFKIKYPSDSKDEDETVSCSLEASLGLRFEGKCKVLYDFRLLSDDYFEASITFDMSADLEASVEGKIDLSIKLGEFGVSPVPGLYVGVRPKLEAEATVSIQAEASLKSVVGGGFDSVNGFVNKSKSPVFTASMEAEGKLFFGINLSPYLTLLQESVADLSLSGRVGVHITAKLEKSTDQDEKVRHSCTNCIDGELYGEASIEATAVLGKDTWLEHEWKRKLFKITTDKSYFYFSLDTMTFGWGPCPNKKFQVACKVTDEDGQPLRGIELDGMLTDENGRCEDYYAAGIYNFELFTPEYEFVRPTDGAFELEEPISLIIVLRYIGDDEPDIEEGEEGPIVAQGNCGPDATWVLYENGDLVISGSGSISFELEDRELIQERAIRADVQEGITEIGYANFIGCAQLQSVNLPQSLQHISGAVFGGCTSLKEIIIPDGVTEIEAATFLECEQLESVKLSDSLTSIGSQAFDGCVQLKEIVLPENVTEIKNRAFYKCEQLESINLPDGLTNVADSSFSCCTSLKEILIPEGVTTIETRAFENCTQLQTVQLPSSLTALGGPRLKIRL